MRYDAILALPRTAKKVIFILHDIIMICMAFWFAYLVRFTFELNLCNLKPTGWHWVLPP